MELRDAAERALRAAASEGLTLVRSSDNATGFRGVFWKDRKDNPFQTRAKTGEPRPLPRGARRRSRTPALWQNPTQPCPNPGPSRAQTRASGGGGPARAARCGERGLTLVRADNATGFKGALAGMARASRTKFFDTRRKSVTGIFATAEEAALAYAREVARCPSLSQRRRRRSARFAAARGATLVRSAYEGFRASQGGKSKPFHAR